MTKILRLIFCTFLILLLPPSKSNKAQFSWAVDVSYDKASVYSKGSNLADKSIPISQFGGEYSLFNTMVASLSWNSSVQVHPSDGIPLTYYDYNQISINSNNEVFVSWRGTEDNYNTNIYLRKSIDGGLTFTEPVLVAQNAPWPHSLFTYNNFVIVVWGDGNVHASISVDGGNTFRNPVTIDGNIGESYNYEQRPDVVIDNTGKIYIVWSSYYDCCPSYVGIFFTKSEDQGTTFSQPVRINDFADNTPGHGVWIPSVAVSPNGVVYAVWVDQRDGIANHFDIYFSRSTDEGVSFESNKRINDENDPDEGWLKIPQIAVFGNNNVYIVWNDYRNSVPGTSNDPDIYFSRSTNGGINFQPNIRVNDDTEAKYQEYPTISVGPNGEILIAWVDFRNNVLDLFTAISRNFGISFDPNTRANSSDERVSFTNYLDSDIDSSGNAYLFWPKYFTNANHNLVLSSANLSDINPCPPPTGWYAEYFDSSDLSGSPIISRCERKVDFYWGRGSPGQYVSNDNFSARWQKTISFPQSGRYKFRTFSDDGVRLFIDGNVVISDWNAHSFDERSAVVQLSQGFHSVVMEYFEQSNEALASLGWYLCPNGLSDCDMDIAPQYQTKFPNVPMPLTASTSPPSNCNAASISLNNIGGIGCKITAIAMALQSLNIETSPVEINEFLSEIPEGENSPRGYTNRCTGALTDYRQIVDFVEDRKGVRIEFVTQENRNPINVQNAIRNNHPVVLWVPGSPDHFVLATDVIRTDSGNGSYVDSFGILDPHHSWNCWINPLSNQAPLGEVVCHQPTPTQIPSLLHKTTVREFSQFTPRVYFQRSISQPTPSLQIDVENADMLVIDSSGQATGFNRILGQENFGIPGAVYFPSEISSPTYPTESLWNTLYLSQAPMGEYRIVIYPYGGTNRANTALAVETGLPLHVVGYSGEMKKSVLDTQVETQASGATVITLNYDPEGDITYEYNFDIHLPIVLR